MTRISFALVVLLFGFSAQSALAQTATRQTPTSRAEVQLSFAPIVRRAAPAVVNVYGARVEEVRNPFFSDPMFRRFFGDRAQGQGPRREEVARSLGSGVIVERSGLVITNNHVIEGMTEVKIALADRREFEVEIVIRDPRTDLAMLRIKEPPRDLATIEIGDSDLLEVGDFVLAIGNPFGVGQTVTQGIVSALARTNVGVADYQSFVQTDAAINPGNSGGALVDTTGKLVGINTAIFSRSGGSHGIGFAIPTALVRLVVTSANAGFKMVRRPWFGATLQTVTADVAETLNLPSPKGALIVSTLPNSPAMRAGIRAGDLVTLVDGQEVADADGFGFRFGLRPLGGTASLTIMRQGRTIIVPVALERAPEGLRDQTKLTTPSPFQGATVATLSPALAEELRVGHRNDGVVVAVVDDATPARQIGLQPGDIVLGVNGERISSPADLVRLTAQRSRLWRVQIDRHGDVINSVFGG